MGRENKKDAIAAFHREQILKAAEKLFSEKGYVQTTIEDISRASEYSRRTIYAYYKSKDDILHHIIEKGLKELKTEIEDSVNQNDNFVEKYMAICMAMGRYQRDYPHSAGNVNGANSADFDFSDMSDAIASIITLGKEINAILSSFIEKGQEEGIVRKDAVPMLTVYVLWSSISALLSLADTKGQFISDQFSISENEFLNYGFKQIINSILVERI